MRLMRNLTIVLVLLIAAAVAARMFMFHETEAALEAAGFPRPPWNVLGYYLGGAIFASYVIVGLIQRAKKRRQK
jgi:hypothetical protein